MHALKYCCFFDNFFWFGKCQKAWQKQFMKPQNFRLGFFTNHLKLVNSIPVEYLVFSKINPCESWEELVLKKYWDPFNHKERFIDYNPKWYLIQVFLGIFQKSIKISVSKTTFTQVFDYSIIINKKT